MAGARRKQAVLGKANAGGTFKKVKKLSEEALKLVDEKAAEIARSHDAERYAPDIFATMNASLKKAEDALARKAGSAAIISAARQSVQFAEDARSLAVQRQQEERIAQERRPPKPRPRQRLKRRPRRWKPSRGPMRKPSARRNWPRPAKRR